MNSHSLHSRDSCQSSTCLARQRNQNAFQGSKNQRSSVSKKTILRISLRFPNFNFNVAKYHLGKVKLERVGQQSSPTSVCDLRGGPRGIAGLLVCPFASVALHCSFAC